MVPPLVLTTSNMILTLVPSFSNPSPVLLGHNVSTGECMQEAQPAIVVEPQVGEQLPNISMTGQKIWSRGYTSMQGG